MATARQTLLATILIASAPLCAAVGLGPIDGVPRLGAPLSLEIPIEGSALDADDLRVDVPGHAEHARLGASDPVIPRGLEAQVTSASNGRAVVRLKTSKRVMEPVIRFMVRVRWPEGVQVREYQVLLDPPTYVAQAAAPRVVSVTPLPQQAEAPSPRPAPRTHAAPTVNPTIAAHAGQRYGPVASGETLGAIVRRAYVGSGHDDSRVAARIVADNPAAFINGDRDRLLQGAWLSLPSLTALAEPQAPVTTTATADSHRTAIGSPTQAGLSYGPVLPGETLYSISRRVTGAPESRIGTIARRIYTMNPDAFIGGDMNRLMVGSTLALDDNNAASTMAQASVETSSGTGTQASGAMPSAQDVAAIREVLASERARTVELQAKLDQAMAELAALEVRAQALNREIEIKSNQLSQQVASLLDVDSKPAGAAKPAASTEIARPTLSPVSAAVAATDAPQSVSAGSELSTLAEQLLAGQASALAILALVAALLGALAFMLLRKGRKGTRLRSAQHADAERIEAIRHRLSNDDDMTLFDTHDDLNIEVHHEPDIEDDTQVVVAGPATADDIDDNVVLTDSARASKLAKQAAVSMAYEDYAGSKLYIEEAIRLEPHRDEHKMVLLTLHQCLGNHAEADTLIDDLLARREQLSGELRAHVEQLSQRRHG